MKLTQETKDYWKQEFVDVLKAVAYGDITYSDLAELTDQLSQEAQEQLDIAKTKQEAIDELGKHLMSLDVDSWEMIGDGGFKLVVGYEEEPEIIPTETIEEVEETFEMDDKTYKVLPATGICEGCAFEDTSEHQCQTAEELRGRCDFVIYKEVL